MAYKINPQRCIKCGLCMTKCPQKAISGKEQKESDGLVLYITGIDAKRCNNCGVCVSEEYWCPAHAIGEA